MRDKNRLAQETSPYLQQHADNPVDWYPWGEEALALARSEDKPVLLSIGYSACHWCHVMAHESFEDAEVAEVMNRLFINIKVDREERPDLDQIYQSAHAMLTQRNGGWPLTMFLMPDGAPFFGGTYFPKTPRYNLPGFVSLLEKVADVYRNQRSEIEHQNVALIAGLARISIAPAHHSDFSAQPVADAVESLAGNYDARFGGFGGAPKFPHPENIELLLRTAAPENEALAMATYTLACMARGGLYDQIGGGFSRYSVDAHWSIPHFEKMLYDNGPLLRLYADAWARTGDPLFARVVEETATWVMREMQSPEGGYYSTLDADSEGVEGKYYVWTPEVASRVLTPDEYQVVARHYGLDRDANFEHEYWHLRITQELPAVAEALGFTLQVCEALLAAARTKLFATREQRIRPGRDEKILVSWNALMIEGMAHAARVFGRADWLDSAKRALGFIQRTMWDAKRERLFATYKDGRAHLNAYLDDYAFLLKALLELLQAGFDPALLEFAEDIADVLLEQFEDTANGGFYFTSHDHEKLIHRVREAHDNATPSGNGVAAMALQRLAHVTGEQRYQRAAERTLQAFYPQMAAQPNGFGTLSMMLQETLEPPQVVVLRGAAPALLAWTTELRADYRPATLLFAIPSATTALPPLLAKPVPSAMDTVSAWVCRGAACLPEIRDIAALRTALGDK